VYILRREEYEDGGVTWLLVYIARRPALWTSILLENGAHSKVLAPALMRHKERRLSRNWQACSPSGAFQPFTH